VAWPQWPHLFLPSPLWRGRAAQVHGHSERLGVSAVDGRDGVGLWAHLQRPLLAPLLEQQLVRLPSQVQHQGYDRAGPWRLIDRDSSEQCGAFEHAPLNVANCLQVLVSSRLPRGLPRD
jgi:hypothetical protein